MEPSSISLVTPMKLTMLPQPCVSTKDLSLAMSSGVLDTSICTVTDPDEIYRLKSTDDPTVQANVMIRNIVTEEVHVLGAGLSGLAAATILARSG